MGRVAILAAILFAVLSAGIVRARVPRQAEPIRMEWTVDGEKREALVYVPKEIGSSGAPLVFGFHGHGGRMGYSARKFQIQKYWPEAIVVYMQGLNTSGMTDPQGTKPGWQQKPGDQNDRDLKFFDAVLTTVRTKYRVDERRIYAMGHSNGGIFTYLLWGQRPKVFAAVAPAAAPAARNLPALTPKPAFHIAGEHDPIVPFAWQKRTIDAVMRINGCANQGKEWAKNCTLYPSDKGTPFVTYIHSGGHEFPDVCPELIVRFFKENPKPEANKTR